jgi:hypothetical protein
MSLGEIVVNVFATMGISAVVATAVGFAVKASIEKGIQHRLDVALESVRSDFRRDEDKLKSAMAADQARMDALQRTVLSGLSSRNQELDKRRLQAIEKLWRAVVDMQPLRTIIAEAAKPGNAGERMKQVANMIGSTIKADDYRYDISVDVERLYVPPTVWAEFVAYRQIVHYPAELLFLARQGVEANVLKDPSDLLALLKSLLPHAAGYVDQFGTSAIPHLIEQLTSSLLTKMVASLEQSDSDARSVRAATALLSLVTEATSQKVEVPDALVSAVPPPPTP